MEKQRTTTEMPREIAGSVDPSTGNIDNAGDVGVKGGVTAAMLIRSKGDVTIRESVDAAEIHADGTIRIGGGAVGRNSCRCIAGKDITVRHANGAWLEAAGHVKVASNLAMARIICGGRLDAPAGAIVGGHITATGGVSCLHLGSPGGAPTLVEAGIDEGMRRLSQAHVALLETQLGQLTKLKEALVPLIRNQKGLTAGEKEKATELIYEAQELEELVERSLASIRRAHDEAQARSVGAISVGGVVYPGVTVRLGLLEAAIPTAAKGPLTFVVHRVGNASCIAIKEQGADAVLPLNTTPFHDPALERLNRILLKRD